MPILVKNLKRSPQYGAIVAGVKELKGMIGKVQCVDNTANEKKSEKRSVTCTSVLTGNSATKASGSVKRSFPWIVLQKKEAERSHASIHIEQPKQSTHIAQKRVRASLSKDRTTVTHRITTSSLTADQKRILLAAVEGIPGAVMVDNLTRTCNLLVINAGDNEEHRLAPRTIKYMLAILRGIPIVSFEWVMESITADRWTEYEQYLMEGDEVCGQVTNASRKSLKDNTSLFDALHFYLSPNIQQLSGPSKQDIVSIIEAGGGTLITARCEGCIYLVNGVARRQSKGPGTAMTVAELFMHVSRYERPLT